MSLVVEHPPKLPTVPVPPGDRPYAMSASLFFAMIEAGILPETARIYLQDGRILEKMAKPRAHFMAGAYVNEALVLRMIPGLLVLPEGQFQIDAWNAKLPDLAIIRCVDRKAMIAEKGPLRAADLLVAIEIAVTSPAMDLGETPSATRERASQITGSPTRSAVASSSTPGRRWWRDAASMGTRISSSLA